MAQPTLKAFLSSKQQQHGVGQERQCRGRGSPARPRQAKLEALPGVVRLPKMSGHATELELQRIHSELDGSRSDEAIVHALKQLACYEITVDQLEAVPLGKRVKQLRQHSNPDVAQQATRLLRKMRQDVTDACHRAARAKPIVAMLKQTAPSRSSAG